MRRQAFTLIELLIVIAIIGLLAALILPALGGATGNALMVKEGRQLGELAKAILQWRTNIGRASNLLFPGRLMDLSDPERGGPLDGELGIYISPADASRGGDPQVGAADLADDWGPVHEPGCSYLYECSSRPAPWDIDFAPPAVEVPEEPSWAEYKRFQQRFGNLNTEGGPAPFAQDVIPVIRSFHHYDWASATTEDLKSRSRVINATWSTRVYRSIPFWEHQANPAIPWLLPDDD